MRRYTANLAALILPVAKLGHIFLAAFAPSKSQDVLRVFLHPLADDLLRSALMIIRAQDIYICIVRSVPFPHLPLLAVCKPHSRRFLCGEGERHAFNTHLSAALHRCLKMIQCCSSPLCKVKRRCAAASFSAPTVFLRLSPVTATGTQYANTLSKIRPSAGSDASRISSRV